MSGYIGRLLSMTTAMGVYNYPDPSIVVISTLRVVVNSSKCLISPVWLEGDSIINPTLLSMQQ